MDKYFDHWYNKVPVSGLNGYAMQYVWMLVYIFCVEVILFWVFTGILVYSQLDAGDGDGSGNVMILSITWGLRDFTHLVLFAVIIKLYFEQIKSEIKYRFCWRNPNCPNDYGYNDRKLKRCFEFMYNILWFNVTRYTLNDAVMKVVDEYMNENEGIEWMEQ